jgi:Uncharacterized conserved protein
MDEVIQFLRDNPVQYLATVSRDGRAKCRPFMFCIAEEGKIWFCTSAAKEVYEEMKSNPAIEVSVCSSSYAWIRLNGEVVFENNQKIKELCLEIPINKEIYQTVDNPDMRVFYLKNAKAVIADMSGKAPKEYIL